MSKNIVILLEMRTFVAILLIPALLIQATAYYSRAALFYLNQDFIAENLCVEKDEENSDCEGSCFLEKELSTENTGKTEQQNTSVKEIKLVCHHSFDIYVPANPYKKERNYLPAICCPHDIPLAGIFRPPLITG